MNPEKVGFTPGDNGGSTIVYHLFRPFLAGIRDGLNPEVVEMGPELDCGPQTEIALAEGDKGRKNDESIRWKMVGLEMKFV